MPKEPKTEKPTRTMFERFAVLARRVVSAPKGEPKKRPRAGEKPSTAT